MNIAYLLTGGNLGDRVKNLNDAEQVLNRQCGTVIKKSSLYETAAWGNTNQPAFLNQAIAIETKLDAEQLIHRILKIEKNMGRIRKEKYGPRLIDIDILLFNNDTVDLPFLKIPHPEMQNRRFVLIPLAEIAAEIIHPVLHKSISKLLTECKDESEVKKCP
ncbi:MAG: 2-amino-4-hydroxy-6-hydroxymethyldihydropteridine diphosphokinase [Bacteroidetes bacterium]|nr:2-amino-4-hydroxy-6-hydroxymethyldihydropteridine diphosphokinase [Bacteroidota bacterium]MBS1609203.1 2-amino-4-hydroxy-6-hydroxymethyldihydropteridine diphosphokinase [Bacteroidota bacterium]